MITDKCLFSYRLDKNLKLKIPKVLKLKGNNVLVDPIEFRRPVAGEKYISMKAGEDMKIVIHMDHIDTNPTNEAEVVVETTPVVIVDAIVYAPTITVLRSGSH